MSGIFVLATTVAASSAGAQQISPDSKMITSVTEAARFCGFDKAGVKWAEASSGALTISVTEADLQPGSKLEVPLKTCFFPWAYDRDVKIEMNFAEPAAKL